jgi:hypothetical protein
VATERPNLATSGINIASMNACTLLAQSPQTTGYGRQERVKSGSRPITLRDDGTTRVERQSGVGFDVPAVGIASGSPTHGMSRT